ncbi:hypothetical protein TREES_T100016631 [Tupaia chinensis]|uniref:Uncharacterized protein n=1 Tax=Tupaia chinensis TaxID=246437 RepID=L9L750_TUPCH|nr:hypothetical protein TREES_T100016631 [Tupaia chinensis]
MECAVHSPLPHPVRTVSTARLPSSAVPLLHMETDGCTTFNSARSRYRNINWPPFLKITTHFAHEGVGVIVRNPGRVDMKRVGGHFTSLPHRRKLGKHVWYFFAATRLKTEGGKLCESSDAALLPDQGPLLRSRSWTLAQHLCPQEFPINGEEKERCTIKGTGSPRLLRAFSLTVKTIIQLVMGVTKWSLDE